MDSIYAQQPTNAQPRPQPIGHEELNGRWVSAGHLKIGDKLKQADGTTGIVANVTTVQQTQEMFNLTVDEAPTVLFVDERVYIYGLTLLTRLPTTA